MSDFQEKLNKFIEESQESYSKLKEVLDRYPKGTFTLEYDEEEKWTLGVNLDYL